MLINLMALMIGGLGFIVIPQIVNNISIFSILSIISIVLSICFIGLVRKMKYYTDDENSVFIKCFLFIFSLVQSITVMNMFKTIDMSKYTFIGLFLIVISSVFALNYAFSKFLFIYGNKPLKMGEY